MGVKLHSAVIVALMIVLGWAAPASAGAEFGIGLIAPLAEGPILGNLVFVPNAVLSAGAVGLAIDAWVAPGNDVYFIFPFLQMRVPFLAGSMYWGIGPTIWGSSEGMNLMPPFAELNVKLGVSANVLVTRAYAELLSTFAPVDQSFSGNTLIVGLRLGF